MRTYKFGAILITSLLLVCGAIFYAYSVFAISIPIIGDVVLTPGGTAWPAGTAKTIQVNYSDFSTAGTSGISFKVCHPTNTTSCVALSPNWSYNGAPSGSISESRVLGLANSNRLYERLVSGEVGIRAYYLDEGNNIFKFNLKICPVNLTGADTANCTTVTRLYVAPSPTAQVVDGGWSNWSTCSATACGTTGTQTRTCINPAPANGGATCSGASSQTCSAPACAVPVINSLSLSPSNTAWPAGTDKNIQVSYSNFSQAAVSAIAFKVCHPTNSTSCAALGNVWSNNSSSASGNISVTQTLGLANSNRLYDRLTNGELTAYYLKNGNSYGFWLKVCPVKAGVEAGECRTYTGLSVAPSPTANPTIVSVNNGASFGSIRAGSPYTFSWNYSGFSSSVNRVQVSACKTTDTGSACVIDANLESYSGSASGTKSIPRTLGNPDGRLYTRLMANEVPLSSYYTRQVAVAPAVDTFKSYFKVCPYNTSNQVVGTCKYSDFIVRPNVNQDPGSSYNLPSGQGCIADECVCVSGVAQRCGNPMKPGTGCPAMATCPAGPVSFAGKMMASVSGLFGWLSSLVLGIK